ncbi:homogentisate 1,2-dioxygenase [Sphingomonas sp. 1P06PA]|uniref:homogentisate 1,2-dioxygenase n=1 Tax=Sphingomonas sp. 1P06PA TaxID=554121 RepID=UPI0039A5D5E2
MRNLVLMMMLVSAPPALAADPAPCPATPAPPPPEFAGWPKPVAQTAGTQPAGAPQLAPGRAVDLALHPSAKLRFAAMPGKPGDAGTSGGIAQIDVKRAAVYRVALAGPAWIDMVRAGKPVASIAHGHGPACSGIRKLVDFRLEPGRYNLQIAGSPASRVRVMIARLP